MVAEATRPRLDALEFHPPSPGSWELDSTHYPRPVARFMTEPEAYSAPMAQGFGWSTRRYGLPILYPEYAFVNGFGYRCARPAPGGELPERFQNAADAFANRLWREDLRRWDEETKPATTRAQLAIQRIDPWSLEREALIDHLQLCYSHLGRMIAQSYRLTGAVLVPLGDFLVQGSELSGIAPAELLTLTRGSTPVSIGADDGLAELADAIRDDPGAAAALASGEHPAEVIGALRRQSGAVGQAARRYIVMVECRLLDGFEVGYPCAFEMPEVLVAAIRGAVEDAREESNAEEETERVRHRVPAGKRDHFDELLAEARLTYRLRDERSVYSGVWAYGLMRRAILSAGDRLVDQNRIEESGHLLEATFREIVSLLQEGTGPSATDLAALAHFRASHTSADAPRRLGDEPPPPPPLDRMPFAAARAARAVGTCIELLFTDADQTGDTTAVRGFAASPGVYEGTARVLRGPEELARVRRGDVLVTGSTSEAFNVALPLVGAIVTDSGGLLSHAAIVSREFGIPGVVGTREATQLVPDGARVRVDGSTGEVMVVP